MPISQEYRRTLARIAPLALLGVLLAVAAALRLDRQLSLDALLSQRIVLDAFVADNFAVALIVYVVASAILIGISLPISFLLCVLSGYLFGLWAGTFAAWLACVIGAGLLFVAGRSALRGVLRKMAGRWITQFESHFDKNAFRYLLTLRLIPAFPFAAVNIVAPFFEIKFRHYILATAIGIVPITLIFTSIGVAMRKALNAGLTLDPVAALRSLFGAPLVLASFGALIAMVLAPLVFRAWRNRPRKP